MLVRIKREVKTEWPDSAAGDDSQGGDNDEAESVDSGEGEEPDRELEACCSRTMGRMPEASLLKWNQRKRQQQHGRNEQSQVMQLAAAAMTVDGSSSSPRRPPTPSAPLAPPDLEPSLASVPKRKALIHPHRKHGDKSAACSANATPIPVGIAVARQRREKCRSDTPMPPVQPKARRAAQSSPMPYQSPTERLCISTPSAGSGEQLFNSPSSLSSLGLNGNYPAGRAVYNPAALYAGHAANASAAANWSWSSNPVDYSAAAAAAAAAAAHSLWPTTDMNSIMGYSTYPPTSPASSVPSSLLHHHHHPAGGLTPPPFLLIPAACLGEPIFHILIQSITSLTNAAQPRG